MKKIFLSLTIVSSMFFVSCEKEEIEETTSTTETTTEEKEGYWDVSCDYETTRVPYTVCDSVWYEGDSTSGETICDSILVGYDSLRAPIYELDCHTTLGYAGPGWKVNCETVYEIETIEVCDSVWISTEVDTGSGSGSGTDSTYVDGGSGVTTDSTGVIVVDSTSAGF